MTARCQLCVPPRTMPMDELLPHLDTVHGIDPDEIEKWPDGELVVIDQTLTPGDFGS